MFGHFSLTIVRQMSLMVKKKRNTIMAVSLRMQTMVKHHKYNYRQYL